LSQVNRFFLALASIFLFTGYIFYAIRWRYLLDNQPDFLSTFHAANAGNMANTLLPLRPGDAGRIILLGGSKSISMLAVTSSIVVERWFEQIMRLAAFGGAIIFGAGMELSWGTILGSLLFLAGSLVFMIWLVKRREFVLEKFPPWLARLPRLTEGRAHHGLSSLIDGLSAIASIRRLVFILALSVVTWTLFWGFHYLCLLSLNQEIPFNDILALSLGSLALVPPSATTLPGVYQVSMVIPMGMIGYDETTLTTYALIMNTLEMLWVIGLGLWGTLSSGISVRELFDKSTVSVPDRP
jgi:uncharacterized protein (TIRG00374 family)